MNIYTAGLLSLTQYQLGLLHFKDGSNAYFDAPNATTATPAIAITTSFPAPIVGTAYAGYVHGTNTGGATGTMAYTVNALPAGLSLNASTGDITGTPTTAGTVAATFGVTNGTQSQAPTHSFVTTTEPEGIRLQQAKRRHGVGHCLHIGSVHEWGNRHDQRVEQREARNRYGGLCGHACQLVSNFHGDDGCAGIGSGYPAYADRVPLQSRHLVRVLAVAYNQRGRCDRNTPPAWRLRLSRRTQCRCFVERHQVAHPVLVRLHDVGQRLA
jgi:hypothetical protein